MMENKKKYEFEVETLQCGQPRPYADSIYDYIVTSDEPERTVNRAERAEHHHPQNVNRQHSDH